MITLSSCAVSRTLSEMTIPYWQSPVGEWRAICRDVARSGYSHSVANDGRDGVLFPTGKLQHVTDLFLAAIAELVS